MRTLIIALVLAATPAAAQPDVRCTVTIARAPEDVRPIVEQWVRGEPSCNLSLEVRIVPTDGGYYILARDEHGRVRERVVPDGQSAGVLIASWIADDTLRAPAPAMPTIPQPLPAPALIGSEGLFAPGEGVAPGLTVVKAAPARRPSWLSLAALYTPVVDGFGLRAELDLKTWPAWSFGVAASISKGLIVDNNLYTAGGYATVGVVDTNAVAYVAHVESWGMWHLREAVGAGFVYTRAMSMWPSTDGWQTDHGYRVSPTGEASLLLGRELGRSWAIATGPIVAVFAQDFALPTSETSTSMSVISRDVELRFAAAVRYRL